MANADNRFVVIDDTMFFMSSQYKEIAFVPARCDCKFTFLKNWSTFRLLTNLTFLISESVICFEYSLSKTMISYSTYVY